MPLTSFILNQTNIPSKSIESTLQLLSEDCTIPFIARYRKEKTGTTEQAPKLANAGGMLPG